MRIKYFYDKGPDVYCCFTYNGRNYARKCNWAGNRLAFRFLQKLWYSEHRAVRIMN